MRHFAEIEVEMIDRFRAHVSDAAAAQRRSIHQRADELPEEIQEFLADDIYELDKISDLADQLAIVALHRVVELSTQRILMHKFGAAAGRKASYIDALRKFLKGHDIDIERIPHYRAMNELRLLNNAIKHAGHVNPQLAAEYSRWTLGEELTQLGSAYDRLKRHVPSYVFRFAESVKLRF